MSTNQLKLASRVMFSDRLYFISPGLTYVREGHRGKAMALPLFLPRPAQIPEQLVN